MIPNVQNLELYRDDDAEFLIHFYEPDTDAPLDAASVQEIRFVLRAARATTQTDDTDATFVAVRGDGIEAHESGAAKLTIPRAVTRALARDVYQYDVQATLQGKAKTTQTGVVAVRGDVGRGT